MFEIENSIDTWQLSINIHLSQVLLSKQNLGLKKIIFNLNFLSFTSGNIIAVVRNANELVSTFLFEVKTYSSDWYT